MSDQFEPPKCLHPRFHLCKFTQVNGIVLYRDQCLTCGAVLKTHPKAKIVTSINTAKLPLWDDGIGKRWWQERAKLFEDHRQEESDEWWRRYEEYLETPAWQQIRERVLERDNWVCQGCAVRPATEVHHLTYQRLFREMLFDLIAVCKRCHNSIHSAGGK
jgi:5-methylcytosine-specific restriction endonuclease McrA